MCSAEIKKTELNLTLGLLDLLEATAEIAAEIGMYAPKVRSELLPYRTSELDELYCLTDSIHNFDRFLNDILNRADYSEIRESLFIERGRLTELLKPLKTNAFSYPSIASRMNDIGNNKLCSYKRIMVERNQTQVEGEFKKFFSYVFGKKSSKQAYWATNIMPHESTNRLHMVKALIKALDALISQLDPKQMEEGGCDLNLTIELTRLLSTMGAIATEMRMYSSYTCKSGGCFPESCMDELKDLSDAIQMWAEIGKSIRSGNRHDLLGILDSLEGELYIYLSYSDNSFALPPMGARSFSIENSACNSKDRTTYYEYTYDIGKMPNFIQRILSKSKIGTRRCNDSTTVFKQNFRGNGGRDYLVSEMLQTSKSIKLKTVRSIH